MSQDSKNGRVWSGWYDTAAAVCCGECWRLLCVLDGVYLLCAALIMKSEPEQWEYRSRAYLLPCDTHIFFLSFEPLMI